MTTSRRWLLIGVFALAIAGLYSLTLVIGRAPMLSNNPDIQRIFHSALVVHVDLSVLLWFLSIACLFWSMATQGFRSVIPYVEEAAQICFSLTILLMMLSPFDPQAEALMSNYIPMISSPIFMLSLGFLLCGVGLMVIKMISSPIRGEARWGALFAESERGCPHPNPPPIGEGVTSAALITLIVIACFFWSYHLMPDVIEGEQYFDMLFWGGGHVLQLLHVQMLMVVWLFISGQWAVGSGQKKWITALFLFNLLVACASPIAYLLWDVESSEFRQFFTLGIMSAGGIAPGILAVLMLGWLWRARAQRKGEKRALWSCALVSALLFLYGGFLALLIEGQNVVIPAHYHGSIVGITLAFMGFAYMMLPHFGWRDMSGSRMAYWQPIIYGVGQVMHVSGLAYSGGYGVLRKTVGGVDALALNIKIALGVMGLGGIFAIIGGLLFVVVVYRSVRN